MRMQEMRPRADERANGGAGRGNLRLHPLGWQDWHSGLPEPGQNPVCPLTGLQVPVQVAEPVGQRR